MDRVECASLARRELLAPYEMDRVWQLATEFDSSLKNRPNQLAELAKRRVRPIPFSRAQLFKHMVTCEPTLFSNVPIRPHGRRASSPSITEEIRNGLQRSL